MGQDGGEGRTEVSRGLGHGLAWGIVVRTEVRTYLRYKGNGRSRSLRDDSQNGKGNGKGRSRFPEGMTERKARAKAWAGWRCSIPPIRKCAYGWGTRALGYGMGAVAPSSPPIRKCAYGWGTRLGGGFNPTHPQVRVWMGHPAPGFLGGDDMRVKASGTFDATVTARLKVSPL